METNDAHLMRATLEGICFQTKGVMQSMQLDTGHIITALNVDGGMVSSDTFLQILTNLCNLPVGMSSLSKLQKIILEIFLKVKNITKIFSKYIYIN